MKKLLLAIGLLGTCSVFAADITTCADAALNAEKPAGYSIADNTYSAQALVNPFTGETEYYYFYRVYKTGANNLNVFVTTNTDCKITNLNFIDDNQF